MIRIIALVAGLCGACVFSQAPEFTQQYQQRLAGQVDALTSVVLDFDASALEAGLGREEALLQMVGTPFLESRQGDMRRTFARHAALSDALVVLRNATPLERLAMPLRYSDGPTFTATWGEFAPALPLSLAGMVAAGLGGVIGWLSAFGLLSLLVMPLRGLKRSAPQPMPQRREPALVRPTLTAVQDDPRPRLMGATR
ncbi:Protein of unknown function [Cognatiyoonia koreensis]|uniref:DUF2937 domain-containing protein n=1 Tax=Cognatiyoonia koreensis TaxID=364200 RepID=A0A1I0QA02_9RHOB|nr:DUF2937 family protein [Cognatiyoonia koreensis]SEW23841.1 Protein of unknown function [Cognatiyoonia koreensis]